ncbi:hypothetical protein O6H91_08G031100 [Diphasiastrum complanatum]|uniref:Uncharacterized protein n=1 Tax=Diphasiastrum complanatum TaxID=34168 RepID=A0ACC2CWF3_DIPCM|nr:hypothetical protein O6H91_08G031100 [Diphasiastrum complanatum]
MAGKSKKRGNKESQVRKNAPSVKKDSKSEGPKEPESGVEDMSTKRSSDDDTLIENGEATSSFLNEDLPEDNSVACYDENGVRKMEGIGIESSRGKKFAAHEKLFPLDKFVNMLMRSVLPRESSENVKLVCNLITTLLSEIGELSKKTNHCSRIRTLKGNRLT